MIVRIDKSPVDADETSNEDKAPAKRQRTPEFRLARISGRANWHIVWRKDDGAQGRVSTGTEDKLAAQAELARFRREWRPPPPPKPQIVTVKTLFDEYRRWKAVDQRADGPAMKRIEMAWHRLEPKFKTIEAARLTSAMFREYVRERRGTGVKDASIRRELAVLRAALRHAAREGLIAVMPAIDMPAGSPPRDVWLTPDEVHALIAAAQMPHVRLFIEIAVRTGARKGAIFDLRWDTGQVDLERRVIDFRRADLTGRRKGRAVVPIDEHLANELRKAKEAARSPWVIEYRGKRVINMTNRIKELALRAGIAKNVTPHTLRHTHGTLAAQSGIPIWKISRQLGHASTATTERYYLHHTPEFLTDVRDAMSAMLAKAKPKAE